MKTNILEVVIYILELNVQKYMPNCITIILLFSISNQDSNAYIAMLFVHMSVV